jgi:hypothetical protein
VTWWFISKSRGIGFELSPLSLLPAILQTKVLPWVPNSSMWFSSTRFRITDCR